MEQVQTLVKEARPRDCNGVEDTHPPIRVKLAGEIIPSIVHPLYLLHCTIQRQTCSVMFHVMTFTHFFFSVYTSLCYFWLGLVASDHHDVYENIFILLHKITFFCGGSSSLTHSHPLFPDIVAVTTHCPWAFIYLILSCVESIIYATDLLSFHCVLF